MSKEEAKLAVSTEIAKAIDASIRSGNSSKINVKITFEEARRAQ